jgi:CTP:molybdopterin cytidylyltransferase MocA
MTVGLVLAAGEGRRMGGPKALLRDESGTPWVVRTLRVLRQGGVDDVVVVVGAAADEVRSTLLAAVLPDHGVRVVAADDWAEGMGASLRAGLRELLGLDDVTAALVCVVDTPGLNAAVVRRVAALAGADVLARATYDGTPGHPVLLGSAHFGALVGYAGGDVGARDYLSSHETRTVECADLADGTDVDAPEDLPPGHRLG